MDSGIKWNALNHQWISKRTTILQQKPHELVHQALRATKAQCATSNILLRRRTAALSGREIQKKTPRCEVENSLGGEKQFLNCNNSRKWAGHWSNTTFLRFCECVSWPLCFRRLHVCENTVYIYCIMFILIYTCLRSINVLGPIST